MNKENKTQIISDLAEKLAASKNFYLADTSELVSSKTSALRRKCFDQDIKLIVVKNTLLQKAMERINDEEFKPLYVALKGSTSIMFSDSAAAPAKLIKEFRATNKKPVLKGAFVEQSVYIGDDQLDTLAAIKSKNELIGDVLAMLQSPMRNVIGALTNEDRKMPGAEETPAANETPAASETPATDETAKPEEPAS
ncbi:MAG: 50S ribosomal protein L10 [Bacteroidota bacterium]|nr:50S ribosomal protein L10 [Bacteroidota bacterium]